jgi:hypothetical protein
MHGNLNRKHDSPQVIRTDAEDRTDGGSAEYMVSHAIVCYPEIDTERIELFRKKHDPTYKLIRAHITVVFGVDQSVSVKSLSDHVRMVLERWRSFDIELGGFAKSWDHWLFLTLTRGNEKVTRLHDELYEGILAPYLRRDIQFIPHIGLGEFVKEKEMGLLRRKQLHLGNPSRIAFDETKYRTALREAQNLDLSYSTRVKKLQMIEIDDAYTTITDIKEFPLGSD